MHFKKLLLLSLFLFSLGTLSSCTIDDRTTITLIGEDSSTIQSIDALKDEYEVISDLNIDVLGYTFEESFERTNVDFASGTGRYDIVLQYNFSLSSFVRNDYVYALAELREGRSDSLFYFEDDLFRNDWEEVGFYFSDPVERTDDIEAVGYPFASNTMVLAYNKEMFSNEDNQQLYREQFEKELAPPTDWNDYLNIARFFTSEQDNTYGVTMHGSAFGWLYYEWVNYAFGMGGGVMEKERAWQGDENTEVTINSPENIAATQLFVDLRPYNKGNFFDVDMNMQAQLFFEGNVAMAIMWSDVIYSNIANEDGSFDDRFGFTVIPGEISSLAGGSFFINRDSDHPDEAFDFILWLLQKDNQIEMTKRGLCSPRKSVYDDPAVAHIPYLPAVKESLERGVYTMEAGPDASLISETISEFVQRAWRGELSVEEALNSAQRQVDNQRPEVFRAIRN